MMIIHRVLNYFLRLSELINVLIAYGSVGAKNMLCCDLFPINWSKENLEGDISLAYFLPIFVNKLQNSFDIVFGSFVWVLLILNVSEIPVLSLDLPISEFITPHVFLISCLYLVSNS